jgi:hypothetical protein
MAWVLCGSSALCDIIEEESDSEEQPQKGDKQKTKDAGDTTNSSCNKEYEVDYISSCTPLYSKLEQGQWGCVVTFLESGYWPDNLFFPDPSSPSQQVRTWVTRRDNDHDHDVNDDAENNQNNNNTNKHKHIRWSQLPLQ